jgi:hypothetical protein
LRANDGIGAGQLCVLAEQRIRQRLRQDPQSHTRRADIVVRLGAKAVELAGRVLDDMGADEEQLRLLAAAAEYQARAEDALEDGYERRAIHFARLAEWWALKAVVVPGGVTDEEVRYLVDLSSSLLQDAREAVGTEPSDLREALLRKAAHLIERGLEHVEAGNVRGIGLLWRGSVICYLLLG